MALYQRKNPAFSTGLKNLFSSGTRTLRQDAFEWISLAAMIAALGIAVWSVDRAGWVRPSTSLTAVLVLAVLCGFFLARTGLKSYILHPLALFIGLIVIFIQGLLILPDPGVQLRVLHMVSDLQAWWHAQVYGAPSPVTLHIVLTFGYLSWLMGYFAAWSLIRKHNPWVAILLGIIVVLVNLNFWRSEKYYFFPIYLAAALLFLCLVTYLKNRAQIINNNAHSAGPKPVYWMAVALCLIVVTVSLAWFSPGFKINPISDFARAHDPFRGSVELYWQSFFAPVPGSKVPTLNHGGQQELTFGGPLELSDQVVFIINADRSGAYWKTQVYDYYSSTGWKTGETQSETIPNSGSGPALSKPSSANEYVYTLIPQLMTDVLPSAGEFAAASIPVIETTLTPQIFTLSLQDSSLDSLLPPDIADAAAALRKLRSSQRRTDQQIVARLPSGLKLEGINRSGGLPESIRVSRVETDEKNITALSSSQALLQQKRATIAVVPPAVVTDSVLDAAGANYPYRITDRYLQLPSELPDRIRELAAEITANSTTPFQKAREIKNYLGTLQYNLSIEAPPAGEDGVDYFLFTLQSGYCNYFASAATVMLRCAGVPARMVVGFVPGQYDKDTRSYIVRDRDYHAWTEVYYPGQGWIELDATPPAEQAASRGNTSAQQGLDFPYYPIYPDTGQGTASDTVTKTTVTNTSYHLFLFFGGYILIAAFLIFWFNRSVKPRNKTAVYSRMVLLASLAGLGPGPRQTELEFSRQLAQALPRQADVIMGITRTYILHHYSRTAPAAPMEVEFKKTWPGLRTALIKRIFRLPFHFHR
jgi:transglutaminase-like putative cysteine protease